MKIDSTVIVALIALVGSVYATYMQYGERIGTLSDGQKLCRAHKPGMYMESITVPKSWKVSNCKNYAMKLEDNSNTFEYSLGCVFEDKVLLGGFVKVSSVNDAPGPEEDCGWYN